MTPAEIWKKLTPSQRVTLLQEAGIKRDVYDDEAEIRAGLRKQGASRAEWSSGAARHALGRRGLLDIGQTAVAPTTYAGFHTPRAVTALGREVAVHGDKILRGAAPGVDVRAARSQDREETPTTDTLRRGKKTDEVFARAARATSHFRSFVPGTARDVESIEPISIADARRLFTDHKHAKMRRRDDGTFVFVVGSTRVELVPRGTEPPSLAAAARAAGYEPETEEGGRAMMQAIAPEHLQRAEAVRKMRALSPGDEIEYTNFTVGGSFKGKAIVTWDHGRSVEARTLGGDRIRLERAQDGSLRRFT